MATERGREVLHKPGQLGGCVKQGRLKAAAEKLKQSSMAKKLPHEMVYHMRPKSLFRIQTSSGFNTGEPMLDVHSALGKRLPTP